MRVAGGSGRRIGAAGSDGGLPIGGGLTPETGDVPLERGLEEVDVRPGGAVRKSAVEAEHGPHIEIEGSLHVRRRARPGLV